MASSAPTPDLLPPLPPPRKRVLWKWSLAFTAVIVAYVVWQIGSGMKLARTSVDAAVQHFHEQLNQGKYQEIVQETDEGFRKGWTNDELLRFFTRVHTKLGNAGVTSAAGIKVTTTPSGTFVTTVYNTKFEKGDAAETFSWLKTAGTLKLHGYNINSKVFVVE